MGMTHLLARMKSLLREQNAWQGHAEDGEQASGSMQPPQSLDALPEEPEDESHFTDDDGDHVSNDENVQPPPDAAAEPHTESQHSPEQLQEEGHSVSIEIDQEELLAASMAALGQQQHDVSCQAEADQPALSHAAAPEAGQHPTRQLTDNPTYTTNPSTPNMGYPSPIIPSPKTSRLAPHDMQHPAQPSDVQQANGSADSEAAVFDTEHHVSPFMQHGHQIGKAAEGTRFEEGVDASSMSREELIATIQDLEQQVVAGQMALAETEERLAFSQQRLHVCIQPPGMLFNHEKSPVLNVAIKSNECNSCNNSYQFFHTNEQIQDG